METRAAIQEISERMQRSVIGQEHIVERLLPGLLADGHLFGAGGNWSPAALHGAMQRTRRDLRLRKPRRDSGLAPLNP